MPKKPPKHGIFCLECDTWGASLKNATVEPVLETLRKLSGLPYLHRDVATRAEFDHYLGKWVRRGMDRYPVLYLGFHGDPGLLHVQEGRGPNATVSLDQLEERLEGLCKGRIIHFGSCSTLKVHGTRLKRFLRTTGAVGLLGFKDYVDWLEAASFELLMLGELQEVHLTPKGLRRLEKKVRQLAPGLASHLDFRVVVDD